MNKELSILNLIRLDTELENALGFREAAMRSENLNEFIEKGTEPLIKFLNGFRNRIALNYNWVLSRDDDCSGQAFCFQIVSD